MSRHLALAEWALFNVRKDTNFRETDKIRRWFGGGTGVVRINTKI